MITRKLTLGLIAMVSTGNALSSEGLYSIGAQPEDLVPLQWIVGLNMTYDDNVAPGTGVENDSFTLNPYVGAKLTNITPQTIIDLYANIGLIYYFDKPAGMDEFTTNNRISVDLYHDVSERLSFSSRNFLSYELEPNYAYGLASSRASEEYYYWSSSNFVDFNWTPRFSTRTGITFSGTDYVDTDDLNRFIWTASNQFRYRLSPQDVATLDYRYSEVDGGGQASNATNQYILAGLEHRFSPNTTARFSAGAQLRDQDRGDSSTTPYAEMSLISNVNKQFRVRSFVRYSMEDYDTLRSDGLTTAEYAERKTLRVGVSSSYQISPVLEMFGGVNYIPTSFEGGRVVPTGVPVADREEDIINAHLGFAYNFTRNLQGSCSYNYTDSSSDFAGRDYDRSRINLGISATF